MSHETTTAKTIIKTYLTALDRAGAGDETRAVCKTHLAPDHLYRGVLPIYDQHGPQALADALWSPFKTAMPVQQRRSDIWISGHHNGETDEGLWVVEMGNFLGDFTADWLGIPASGQATYLPFVSLYRVAGGAIVETVEFLDLLAVLTQVGQNPFAKDQSGGHMMPPGPRTHDGLLTQVPDKAQTRQTQELTIAMLTELAESYTSPADHLARFWHPDMNWFGPAGIGASLGFSGYRRGHTGPFETKLETVEIHDWELCVAQGNFSAVMWWPCLTMRNIGGFMGLPASDALAHMRVVDLYRRDADKLAENWIFIDMLHFAKMQGVDILADIGAKR